MVIIMSARFSVTIHIIDVAVGFARSVIQDSCQTALDSAGMNYFQLRRVSR